MRPPRHQPGPACEWTWNSGRIESNTAGLKRLVISCTDQSWNALISLAQTAKLRLAFPWNLSLLPMELSSGSVQMKKKQLHHIEFLEGDLTDLMTHAPCPPDLYPGDVFIPSSLTLGRICGQTMKPLVALTNITENSRPASIVTSHNDSQQQDKSHPRTWCRRCHLRGDMRRRAASNALLTPHLQASGRPRQFAGSLKPSGQRQSCL